MFNTIKYLFASVVILLFQISNLGYSHAKTGGQSDQYNTKLVRALHTSTYVTYETDPEHYDVPGNASRTCGKGYNPMNKQHRRNHRNKRPHVHPKAPWRPGCPE